MPGYQTDDADQTDEYAGNNMLRRQPETQRVAHGIGLNTGSFDQGMRRLGNHFHGVLNRGEDLSFGFCPGFLSPLCKIFRKGSEFRFVGSRKHCGFGSFPNPVVKIQNDAICSCIGIILGDDFSRMLRADAIEPPKTFR